MMMMTTCETDRSQAVLLCNTHWMSINEQEEVFFCPFHLLEPLLPRQLKKMHSKSVGTGRSNRAIRLQSWYNKPKHPAGVHRAQECPSPHFRGVAIPSQLGKRIQC